MEKSKPHDYTTIALFFNDPTLQYSNTPWTTHGGKLRPLAKSNGKSNFVRVE
jgi:hypothetical protein